ncbi:phosphoserine aminotransferase apoenzyme [Ekhidna lutea]|uniref:phosphoserine transaminase n=1 Tax=Ekhidna lutea TaxID=447679 RepID=A0A239HDG0_EKHLU|nr:aminotransferase class V-fold PLP-dependent enzyme [Ekhidna lutea]SNS79058.1 phosphoserine aminotransferase apoenzyme [Ekhidna lutea]
MPNKIYFTPGPAQLFYTFEEHLKKALFLDIPSISHRSKTFIKVVEETNEALKELLELPNGYDIFFLNSANEAWDRIIQNLVINTSHHFANGSFSKKFYDFAIDHNKKSAITESSAGNPFQSMKVSEEAELIGITKNETSVGYTFTEDEIAQLRKENPDKLIALDIVSASPSLPVDFSQVDTAYFSVQKGFGMPPGLGIWITNEKCLEKAEEKAKTTSLGSYRALPNLKKFGAKNQTPETPNMLFIYILGKIAQDIIKAGATRMRNDTTYKATLLNQAIENHPLLDHFVSSQKHRSKTTVVAKTSETEKILKFFESRGLVLGTGYGSFKENHIRIANFPTHSKESVEMVCDLMKKIE